MDEFPSKNSSKYITDQYSQDKGQEICSAIEFINSSYNKVDCHALPYPGKIFAYLKNFKLNNFDFSSFLGKFVATGRIKNIKYDGRWSQIDNLFKDELTKLIENILKPENLVFKKVSGKYMNGSRMLQYITQISNCCHTNDIQNPTTDQLSVNLNIHDIIPSLVNEYKKLMRKNLKTVMNLAGLEDLHKQSKIEIIIKFENVEEISKCKNKINLKQTLEQKIIEFNDNLKLKFEKASSNIYAKIKEVNATIENLEIAIANQNLILQNLNILTAQNKDIQLIRKAELTLLLEQQRLKKMISEKETHAHLKNELQTQIELEHINKLIELESYYF